MHRRSLCLPALLLAGLLHAGPRLAATASVTVSDAWIRLLPGNVPLAGYFEITNTGTAPLRLSGAAGDAFGRVIMHRSVEENGVSRMRPVATVEIAPGATLRFEPGGYHLMLMDRRRDLQVGNHVPIVLEFGGGGSVSADFVVRGASGQ